MSTHDSYLSRRDRRRTARRRSYLDRSADAVVSASEIPMAHRLRKEARYVQRELRKETGAQPSYMWCLRQVQQHMAPAQEYAVKENVNVKYALLTLIRPLNQQSHTGKDSY